MLSIAKQNDRQILIGETIMSIEKKSLISTLKTTKKANIAGAPVVDSGARKETMESTRALNARSVVHSKELMARSHVTLKGNTQSLKSAQFKSVKLTSTKKA
jgi:hypothetical protein